MAKQISAIKFSGTLGNVVGFTGVDGKVHVMEKTTKHTNPQTVDQMNQRARFKLASQVAGMIGEVGKLALKANGYTTGRRGILSKQLMEKIFIVSDQKAALPRVLNLVKNPVVSPFANDINVYVDAVDNVITGVLENVPEGTLTAKALLVWDRDQQQWTNVSALDTSSEISLRVPNQENCDVYFYVEVVVPRTSAGKARLDQLVGDEPGYTISVSRLDATNFAYSRTLNAGIVDGQKYRDTYDGTPSPARLVNVNTTFRSDFQEINSWPVNFYNHDTGETQDIEIGSATSSIQLPPGSYTATVEEEAARGVYPRLDLGEKSGKNIEFDVPEDTDEKVLSLDLSTE